MNKRQAIDFLRTKLSDIPNLSKLQWDNVEYPVWRDEIQDVLEEVFGSESKEYKKFYQARKTWGYDPPRNDYNRLLRKLAAVIRSIVNRHEILGIETEPTTKAEPPESLKDFEEKGDKELELILEGTPDMLLASINNVVKNLNSQEYKYSFQRTSGRPDYTNWDKTYFASYAVSQGTEGKVGTISFQLVPNERTLLKTSRPQEWNSSFKYFLDALFAEFEQLGYVKKEKTAIVGLPPEAPTAKTDWKAIQREFGITKMSFGKKINFITDTFRRTIIFRDAEQALALASSGFSKPAVILAGGVIEELLRLYLEHKQIKPIKNDFDGYIQTCEQHRLLKDSVSRLSHSVRQFRNLVHLSAEETKKHTISKATAIGAVSSIFTIANDF
jgi:hypothetical protein